MSVRRRALIGLAALGLSAVAAVGAGGMAIATTAYKPPDTLEIAVRCAADTPEMPVGEPITALVWNIQFGASRNHHFFYDGGTAVSVAREEVVATLDGIGALIARHDPDLVLLQEVDRDSRRTHHIDEHRALLDRVPYPCDASTPYHKVGYVPHPSHEHLGAVDMHLSVASRYRIHGATRFQLPLLQESWLRQQFNLRRALMQIRFPIAGGGEFEVYNAHLSAFSRGDGTLVKQVAAIEAHLSAAEEAGTSWILGADLNSLPPGDDPARLGDDAALYAEAPSPITPLFAHYQSPVPPAEYADNPQPWRTWIPFGAVRADRTLDYIFAGRTVEIQKYTVLADVVGLSDHHPLLVTFVLTEG